MYKTKVLLNSLDKVRRFINIVSHFDDVDMDICCGRYIVDAKSIMGILSMSLTTPLELRINAHDKHLEEILDEISEFEYKEEIKFEPAIKEFAV